MILCTNTLFNSQSKCLEHIRQIPKILPIEYKILYYVISIAKQF
jgi:hypothetical protein